MLRPLLRCQLLLFYILFNVIASTNFSHAAQSNTAKSIAFYYANMDSVRELLSYQRVVIESSSISALQLQQLKSANTEVFAYLSVGEANPSIAQLYPKAIIGNNKQWQAKIMDANQQDWRNYLVQKAQQLKQQGYDGVFLDTLDSYQLAVSPKQYAAQQHALVSLIDQLQVSNGNLILNRGFNLLSQLKKPPYAVVAESLINGYDVENNAYFRQTSQDTLWLSSQLDKVKQAGIEAIVIDYLPPEQAARIEAAGAIQARGYTPYISDGLLSQFGVSSHYPIARRVLGFYDGNSELKKQSYCHRYLSVLIEYYGYVPQCENIHDFPLTANNRHQFAAVIYWLAQTSYNNKAVQTSIEQVINQVPTVFIGKLPDNSEILSLLGLKAAGSYEGKLSIHNASLTYPLPSALPNQFTRYLSTDPGHKILASLYDQKQQQGIAVASTTWGGVLLEPLNVQELINNRSRWPLDPFEYLMPLLKLEQIPVPDITTESGRRVITAHIDGDGFPSVAWLPGKPFAGQSVYEHILSQSTLPHTVSVVEAEIAKHGLYPDIADKLEQIARKIFQLDNVEVASHTFSHPFFWDERINVTTKLYGDSLPVPNYTQDLNREIDGSVNYINQQLAPKDKPVKVFLWSGMANPTEDVIAKTQQLGLLNVNGGNTFILKDNYSISQVYPHLNWYKDGVQVYAPTINENLYTALWTANYNSYSRVTETFDLLGKPRRLKPVSIYYHMYSGVYPSSLAALKQVYKWAQQQTLTPLYLSEYAQRATALYETGIAKSINDTSWYISSTGIKSLRIASDFTLSAQSEGIAGVTSGPDGRYVSLTQARSKLTAATNKQDFNGNVHLESANGQIQHWQRTSKGIHFTIQSHQPLDIILAKAQNCSIASNNSKLISSLASKSNMRITSPEQGYFDISVACSSTQIGEPDK